MSYQSISHGVTTVDCQKQVRSWRLLRSLMKLLIPNCNCTFTEEEQQTKQHKSYQNYYYSPKPTFTSSSTPIVTGTIFGFRRGKVSFCVQTNSKSNPILLLEFSIPTSILAREMQGGILRIALESTSCSQSSNSDSRNNSNNNHLLSMPLWTMFCNGKKSGYAVKRRASKVDLEALRLMSPVVVGAGVVSGKELGKDDELMYLRANFGRVSGSSEAESFHLIDPDRSIGQELSVFFFRSP